jgi:hypothetical protein
MNIKKLPEQHQHYYVLMLFREWNGVKFTKGAYTISGIPVTSIPETTFMIYYLISISLVLFQ